MQTSKTIAALLGPTLLVGALSVLLNWPSLFEQAIKDPALIMLSGFMLLPAGLAIVNFHNRRTSGWPILVTILGWLFVLGGFLRIVFPTQLSEIGLKMTQSSGSMPVLAVIFGALGAFLSYKAYSRK
jgi:hypothetical protein